MNVDYIKDMPIIYDIAPKNLWIPFGAAAGCYLLTKVSYSLLPKCLDYCFPRVEDHWPLAHYRTRIRLRILDDIDNLYPNFANFIKIDLQNSLQFAIFVILIIRLKQSTSYFADFPIHEKIFKLTIAIPLLCGIAMFSRRITAIILNAMSYRCRYAFTSNLLNKPAKSQAAALTTQMITNNLEKGYAIDLESIIRLLAICRKAGQGMHNPILNHAPTVVELTDIVLAASICINEMFGSWYEVNGAQAPGVEFDVDYQAIPEPYHDNPIFNQFICPITQAPIRFPVTAPNKRGGPDHHFERKAILEWLARKDTNPLTNESLEIYELRENEQMRKIIEDEMRNLNLLL